MRNNKKWPSLTLNLIFSLPRAADASSAAVDLRSAFESVYLAAKFKLDENINRFSSVLPASVLSSTDLTILRKLNT